MHDKGTFSGLPVSRFYDPLRGILRLQAPSGDVWGHRPTAPLNMPMLTGPLNERKSTDDQVICTIFQQPINNVSFSLQKE